eukprot:scaffold80485_cov65-Phaeocystis_antarctica.AAC.2
MLLLLAPVLDDARELLPRQRDRDHRLVLLGVALGDAPELGHVLVDRGGHGLALGQLHLVGVGDLGGRDQGVDRAHHTSRPQRVPCQGNGALSALEHRAARCRTQRAKLLTPGQRTSFRILRASSWAACSNSLRCLVTLSSVALIFLSESAVDLCMALHLLSCSASSLSSVLERSLSAVPTVSSNSTTERCSFLSAFFCVVDFCAHRGRDGGAPTSRRAAGRACARAQRVGRHMPASSADASPPVGQRRSAARPMRPSPSHHRWRPQQRLGHARPAPRSWRSWAARSWTWAARSSGGRRASRRRCRCRSGVRCVAPFSFPVLQVIT